MTQSLADELRAAATPPPPKGWKPEVIYAGQVPKTITTGLVDGPRAETQEQYQAIVASLGVPIPVGYTLQLAEAALNTVAWQREPQDRGSKDSAFTGPAWRYRFKVVPSGILEDDLDLKALFAEAKRAKAPAGMAQPSTMTTMVINLGDFQVGKVDSRGGLVELLARNAQAKAAVIKQIRKIKPVEVVLVDGGDAMEGFESSPNADRTNDLQQTEQMRVWRRLFWGWVHDVSRLVEDVKVVGVPSNHCRVRRGKAAVGSVNDDYGLEVVSQLADMAEVNPEAYGHVTFHVPPEHDEHLALTLASGKVWGAAHGHQKGSPQGLLGWLEGQAAGRSPIGHADYVSLFHFHNLYVQTWGDDRWAFGCPTMDSGSSWFRNISGKESRAGVLTFVIDENGWRDLFVAWTD